MSVFSSSRLANKTVCLTGASSGIGKATATLFAKAGSNVILIARRADALASTKEACVAAHKEGGSKSGGQFSTVVLDVSDRQAVSSLWDKIPAELRNIDILVNNAGFVLGFSLSFFKYCTALGADAPLATHIGFISGLEHVGNIADADIDAMFSTNVIGLISMTQLFVKHFKERNAGHIINIGSIAGVEPYAGASIYCATKHAVDAFNGVLRRELVSTPIRVTQFLPGMVDTEFSMVRFRGDKAAAEKVYEGLTPLSGQDVAEDIVWAASRPPHVQVAEVVLFPTNQAAATVNYRTPKL